MLSEPAFVKQFLESVPRGVDDVWFISVCGPVVRCHDSVPLSPSVVIDDLHNGHAFDCPPVHAAVWFDGCFRSSWPKDKPHRVLEVDSEVPRPITRQLMAAARKLAHIG